MAAKDLGDSRAEGPKSVSGLEGSHLSPVDFPTAPLPALRDSASTTGPAVMGDLLIPPTEGTAPDLLGGDRAKGPAAKSLGGKNAEAVNKPAAQKEADLGSLLPHLDKPLLDGKPLEKAKSQETLSGKPLGKPWEALSEKPLGAEAAPEASASKATVEKAEDGDPVLVIQVGWKDVSRASMQVALVVDPKADLAKIEPIVLDGARAVPLWEEQVGAINKPLFPNSRDVRKTSTVFLEYGGAQQLRVRARVNSLGRPAAYAVQDREGTPVVFYLLDRWADAQGSIRIALADLDVATMFVQPGQLKIWLLGDEKVVTSLTTTWPGKVAASVSGQPASDARPTQPEAKDAKKPSQAATASGAKTTPSPSATSAASPSEKAGERPPAGKASTAASGKPAPAVPAKTPEPPKASTAAPAKPTVAAPPKTGSAPAAGQAALPPGKQDIQAMSISDLTAYIERTYGDQMSQTVRKAWLGGMRNYFHSENPEVVRRDVFMALLRACWKEQRPGEMRNAFAVLYLKLKDPSEGAEKK